MLPALYQMKRLWENEVQKQSTYSALYFVLFQHPVWEKGHKHEGNTFGTPCTQEEYLWKHKQTSHDDESSRCDVMSLLMTLMQLSLKL
jgi:hypothetical protein